MSNVQFKNFMSLWPTEGLLATTLNTAAPALLVGLSLFASPSSAVNDSEDNQPRTGSMHFQKSAEKQNADTPMVGLGPFLNQEICMFLDLQDIGRLCATSTDTHKGLYQSDDLWISLAQRECVKLLSESSPLEQLKEVLPLFADESRVYKVSIPRLIYFRDHSPFSLPAGNFAYRNRGCVKDYLDWLVSFDKDAYVTFKFTDRPMPFPDCPARFEARAYIILDEAIADGLKFNNWEYESTFNQTYFDTPGKTRCNNI